MTRISKTYGSGETSVHALREVDLVIERGDYVAIMGASGSGKSTLMNIVGCLDVASAGRYRLDGIDVRRLTERRLSLIRNRKIGFVFQGFNLLSRTSAIDNVELPLLYRATSKFKTSDRHKRAIEVLDAVGLGQRHHHMPNQLSGGQQQRVAIARALINEPSILLADEPTGNLDSVNGANILQLLTEWTGETKTALVLVTHSPEAASICHREIHLRDGQIESRAEQGAPDGTSPSSGARTPPPRPQSS